MMEGNWKTAEKQFDGKLHGMEMNYENAEEQLGKQ